MIEGVRGVRSIEGLDAIKYTKIINTFHNLCIENNFELIVLPTLEKADLFSRTVGEFSDIVTKQMYNFKDKKGRELVLRPEGTAGVMRNYIENKYKIEKFYFYSEQMFRYERPQKGRFREFHQVGAEIIGSTIGNIKPISQIVLLGKNFIDKLYDNTALIPGQRVFPPILYRAATQAASLDRFKRLYRYNFLSVPLILIVIYPSRLPVVALDDVTFVFQSVFP